MYKVLPAGYKPGSMRAMPRKDFLADLPQSDPSFSHRGDYYCASKHDDMVAKTSRDDKPLLNPYYREDPLREVAETALRNEDSQFLEGAFPKVTQAVLTLYLRAKIDHLNYLKLCQSINNDHLVDQAVIMLWKRGCLTGYSLNEILLQPFVPGIRLNEMIMNVKGTPRLEEEYENIIPELGPQLRELTNSPLVDPSPLNYIFTPDGKLVYIDYQPVTFHDRAAHNRHFMDLMLSSWGY